MKLALETLALAILAVVLPTLGAWFVGVTWTRGFAVGCLLAVLALTTTISVVIGHWRLWRQVRVEVSDTGIAVRHGGSWLHDPRVPPQPLARAERMDIVGFRESTSGLVVATRYATDALVVPIELEKPDFLEIKETLSSWCGGEGRRVGEGTPSGARGVPEIRKALRGTKSPFYQRAGGVLQAGGLVGVVLGALPALLLIVRWSSGRDIPRDLAWILLSAYVVGLFATLFGVQIAIGWADYALDRAGLSLPVRTAIWVAIAALVPLSALAYSLELSPVEGIAAVGAGMWSVAGIAWLVSARQEAGLASLEGPGMTERGLGSQVARPGIGLSGMIEGGYRLTYSEFLLASGYTVMSRPRSRGKPRLISAFLPRSVDAKAVRSSFERHPNRNQAHHFTILPQSISWQIEETEEQSWGWGQVRSVIRTPGGFLLQREEAKFDWIPLHAFTARDGPAALTRLAKEHTAYREIR